jgi:hypothetical protein
MVWHSIIGEASVSQVCISHLQFADDTLIVSDKSWANIKAIKPLLILFEMVSRPKVNFYKSMLVDVNVDDNWLFDASMEMNCKIGHLILLWLPLIEEIRKRLSGWEIMCLSLDGRLVLFKYVLSLLSLQWISL